MADTNCIQVPSNTSDISKSNPRNHEQLIEQLERVIQEKNSSIFRLEERERYFEDILRKRNTEFHLLEEQLKQFEEKTYTFEQLHHLQVQTFEKTIRDCQIENERLCEQINDLTRELNEKNSIDEINREKVLTFNRIVADTQLWRQKLDSYKETIEQREETINNLKKELNDCQRKKQTNGEFEDSSLRLQISSLQNIIRDRDNEIENLKITLCRVRDTLQPNPLSRENRWKSCSDDIGRNRSSSPCDIDFLKAKLQTLTDRLTYVQQLLVKRDNQILTLKKVHDKRWLRLKHLQKQYNSLKDELQSYTDDEIRQTNYKTDFFYRKAIRKTRNGCSVCNDQRWRKQTGLSKRILRQEDDDHVWNEVTKLRRDNNKLTNENLSLHEKIDLQEVEVNEQTIVIEELRNEIQRLKQFDEKPLPSSPMNPINDEQKRLVEELDKRLYELETERTNLIIEHERLKTNFDLSCNEKQHLIQQKTQINSELKKAKLRILALQDQIHKLKRDNQLNIFTKKEFIPILPNKRRIIQKKPKKNIPIIPQTTKSCLEILLDQNATIIDDLQNESLISNRPRQFSCNFCNHPNDESFVKRKRRPSISSSISKTRYLPVKRCSAMKSRRSTPLECSRQTSISSTIQKFPLTRITTLQKRIEQLETDLTRAQEDNQHLNQRLTTTLSRINILKSTNQKLTAEYDKFKTNQSTLFNQDSNMTETSLNIENLNERLRNASFDAAQQRKLNRSLQLNNDLLNKNLRSLTDKLTHTERDIASKRTLIENYKTRLNEMETSLNRSTEKPVYENDEERVKILTETMEKLRISIDSYKNRLQAITREKHDLDTRYNQLNDEHQKLKFRYDDSQTKIRFNDQQIRQSRLTNDELNQQLLTLNNRNQDSMKKITSELDRTIKRLNDYERFINTLFQELIRRSTQNIENLKRAREYQKHRDSLSTTLPGYESAMHTASRILNLTQDDLDEIMSVTDDSFQMTTNKDINIEKNEKIRQKISKLLISQEECASKLLKIFMKKLDEVQTTDKELAIIRNA